MKKGGRFCFVMAATLALTSVGLLRATGDDPVATAAKRDEELLAASKKASIVKSGKETYVGLCQTCHADPKAKGDSPSNLFDSKWFHGSRPHEIERTILQGVLEKNMPGWGAVLPPEDTTAVTAYLLSVQKS